MRRHEIWGILSGATFLLLTLSLWSYDVRGGDNWVGVVGDSLAGLFVTAFGLGAYVLPIELLFGAFYLFGRRRPAEMAIRAGSTLVLLFIGCAMLHLVLPGVTFFGGVLPGGTIGEVLGEVMRSLVGLVGSIVVGATVLLITLLMRTSISIVQLSQRAFGYALAGAQTCARSCAGSVNALWEAWREAREIERQERARAAAAAEPRIVPGMPGSGHEPGAQADEQEEPAEAALELDPAKQEDHDAVRLDGQQDVDGQPDLDGQQQARHEHVDEQVGAGSSPARTRGGRRFREPVIVAPSNEQTGSRKTNNRSGVVGGHNGSVPFVLPPPSLLSEAGDSSICIDAATLKENAARLVEKLAAYGVNGRVDEIHPGPVVTMYEFEPASGTKISKIASLSDDLALALAAQKVRIVAPIPGKARVGFELPNPVRKTVYLRSLLEDERWHQIDYALPIALGKDIAGRPVYGDLSRMPHLLVAGATGSGKSVGLMVMLVSLLTKKTPEQVRLLMIDPKVVELEVFDDIPHMLLPVVTDMKKAALALRWAVDEMERRYQLFADAGARNITSYNDRVDKVIRGEAPPESLFRNKRKKAAALKALRADNPLDAPDGADPDGADFRPEKLPHVVLMVDEFSDLMMVAAKDVESAIARLAQKARAAGIHVILATQRPSVDVITGMIKANFPCRIAYKVSQREDSKTILGRSGAENLLGNGDMLALMPGSSDLKRVHSAFIDQETEVRAVCDFLRAQGSPQYDEEIIKPRDDDDTGFGSANDSGDDSLYDRAVAIVAQAGYCSISHLQRNLSIGYNKAAKIVERMEKEGVVGQAAAKAGGRREVLVQPR